MDKKEVLLYGMIVQADIFVYGFGSTDEDSELVRKALFKTYGSPDEMSDEERKNIEDTMTEDNKKLLVEYREKTKKFVGDTENIVLKNDIKIRQYYLGNGGKEGYFYDLIVEGKKIGEIENLPVECNVDTILKLDGKMYKITEIYDCELSKEELETMWYSLVPYEFVEDYELKIK